MTAWIGLTGGIGSGKSQAAACFSALGIPVIDADKVNRQIIEHPAHPALAELQNTFGAHILDGSGCLNKQAVRELIFHDPQAKEELEHILHPHIIEAIRAQQEAHTPSVYGIIELPTLTEHPIFQPLVCRVLLISCPESVRIRRVMQRNGWEEQAVRDIIRSQASDEERLGIADDVIDNSGSLNQLQSKVAKLHRQYLRQFAP